MIEVWVELVPSDGCEQESIPSLSPRFWWFAGNTCFSLACRSQLSSSRGGLFMCMALCLNFPFLQGH